MLNPLMLLGLLGLSVPILIHLINRRRMKPRQLATVKFLDQHDVANAFAPAPRDVLQLLLRLLLLTLFVLLMVRLTAPAAADAPRVLAIVLDNSMSMRRLCPDGKTTLFDQHRARVLQLVRGMREADSVAFTLVGDKVFDATGFTRDRAALERAVTNAWVSDGGGRGLYPAIEEQLKQLKFRRAANMALLVFSDQQAINYRARPGALDFDELLRGTAIQPVFIQDPLVLDANVELQDATFDPDRANLGASAKMVSQLHNAAATQQTVTVSLRNGSDVADSRTCLLASNETARVELRETFGRGEDTAWTVSLSEDGFNADNDAYASIRMLKQRDVLLVAPTAHYPAPEVGTIGTNGPDLFACAVNPSEATGEALGQTFVSVKRIGPEELAQKALSAYSMIVLYGIQELAPKAVQDLAEFAQKGGGLYFVPDEHVMPAEFNRKFEPLLGGIQLTGEVREPRIPAMLDTRESGLEDPLLLGLVRGEWGTVNDLTVSRYFTLAKSGNAKTALRTRDGDILLAMTVVGKGRVGVQAHGWGVRETSLPRSLSFVSVAHAIVDCLCAAGGESVGAPDRIRAGDFHRMALPQFRGLGGQVVLDGPRRAAFAIGTEDSSVNVHDLYVAGAYRATHAGKPHALDRWLAVNRSLAESDPAFLSAEQLAARCGGRKGVTAPSDRVDKLLLPRRELTWLLLALVFAALAVETAAPLLFRRKKEAHGSGA